MEIKHRIPTSQYAYVEFTEDVQNVQEGMVNHQLYISLYTDKVGLSQNDWAKARKHMLETGEFDPNLFDELSKAQRYFVNELKKGLRSLEAKEPTIN